jgi:hypothetical protein
MALEQFNKAFTADLLDELQDTGAALPLANCTPWRRIGLQSPREIAVYMVLRT